MKAKAKDKLQQAAAMAASAKTSTFCFQDAMEKTWFRTNILLSPSPPDNNIPDDHSEPPPKRYELEDYEVRGFMDLGFVFDKEELSAEIVSMIPGLQRLGREEGEEEKSEEEEGVGRPYLSEAWLAKRDHEFISLPSLFLPTWSPAGGDDDVKRELRFWAREVASAVHHTFSC